jgi:P pilus assembly chaperone PapD
LEIQPSLLELSPRPEERLERTITLVNGSDEPLTVSARVGDWTMSATGEVSFLEPGRLTRSCASWIRVEPERQVVPPHGRAGARVAVRAPAGVSGTHWAVVFFSLPETATTLEGRKATVAARVGLTVYSTIEGTEQEDFDFQEMTASGDGSGKATLRALFENRGNTAVRIGLTWQIKSEDGKFVRAYSMPSVMALPGSRRETSVQVDEQIPPGSYTVTAMARWGARRWAAKDVQLVIGRRATHS